MYAHCGRTGLIELSRHKNISGLICVASGTKAQLEETIGGLGRLSKNSDDFFVPGVPEAVDDDAALEAVIIFTRRCSESLGR